MATKPWARKTLIGTKVGGRPGWEWGSEIKQQLSYLGALLESLRAGVLEKKVTNTHKRGRNIQTCRENEYWLQCIFCMGKINTKKAVTTPKTSIKTAKINIKRRKLKCTASNQRKKHWHQKMSTNIFADFARSSVSAFILK